MARSAITVRLEGTKEVFGKQRKKLSPLMQPGMVSMIDGAVKRSFARDFRDEGHHEPAGGFSRWAPTHPFGICEPAPKILGGLGGRYHQALAASRPIPSASRDSLTFISSSVPGLRAHLDGAKIRVTPAQRFALGLGCDAWVKEGKILVLPRRPFGTKNPALARDIERGLPGVLGLG